MELYSILFIGGIVGFLYALARKFNVETRVKNEWLHRMLICDFCLTFWLSMIVASCFGLPHYGIIIIGLWSLVNFR